MPALFDVIVLGAGAAGMYCAAQAGRRGLRVALVDHAPRLAEKIRISGGGRCNFTNRDAGRIDRFVGENPAFARSALRALPPSRFIEQVRRHGIAFHEKHRGQLFCDDSSERIVTMLRHDCDAAGVQWFRPVEVAAVEPAALPSGGAPAAGRGFVVHTRQAGALHGRALVVATGGLAIPKIGATDLGLRIARQFGLRVVEPRPALVPLRFDEAGWRPYAGLAGVALPVRMAAPDMPGAPAFDEDLLFTHRGLSGPAVLQVSTFWRPGAPVSIDLGAGQDLAASLVVAREGTRQQLSGALATLLPRRLAQCWLAEDRFAALAGRRLAEIGTRDLARVVAALRDWRLVPTGSEGFRKAEAMAGGVATDALDPRSMQSLRVPGLFFVGEVVDITGWLGGYNFQWAWASGFLAGQAVGR